MVWGRTGQRQLVAIATCLPPRCRRSRCPMRGSEPPGGALVMPEISAENAGRTGSLCQAPKDRVRDTVAASWARGARDAVSKYYMALIQTYLEPGFLSCSDFKIAFHSGGLCNFRLCGHARIKSTRPRPLCPGGGLAKFLARALRRGLGGLAAPGFLLPPNAYRALLRLVAPAVAGDPLTVRIVVRNPGVLPPGMHTFELCSACTPPSWRSL
jgi:hypothetical protein